MTNYSIEMKVMSYFCQILENDILYKAYNRLKNMGYIQKGICALEYDGLCLPPHPENTITDKVIDDLNNQYISMFDVYEYVTFKIKGYEKNADEALITARREMPKDDEEKAEEKDDIGESFVTDINGKPIPVKDIYCYGSNQVVPVSFDDYIDALSAPMMGQTFMNHLQYLVSTTFAPKNNPGGGGFYVYYENRWKDNSTTTLEGRQDIRNLVTTNLYQIVLHYIMTNFPEESDFEKKSKAILMKKCRDITAIGVASIVEHIVFLTKKGQKREFDMNKSLLGFENGVYDLQNFTFRKYEYTDYITMSTQYDYKEMDMNNADDKKLYDTLQTQLDQIMPSKSKREFLLKVCASMLDGYNLSKTFFLTGVGGNGKGSIAHLNSSTIGGYYVKPENAVLDGFGSSGSGPNEGLYSLNLKRCINFQELKKIDENILKKISGSTSMDCHQKFGTLRTISLDSNMVLEFNENPAIGRVDGGVKRRVILVKFESEFLEETEVKKKKADGVKNVYVASDECTGPEFGAKFKYVWLKMLIDTYKKHKNKYGKLDFNKLPKTVYKDTQKYFNENDVIGDAFHTYFEKFIPEDGKRKYISLVIVRDTLAGNTDYQKKNISANEVKKWLDSNFGTDSYTTHNKTCHLVNFRRIIFEVGDEDKKTNTKDTADDNDDDEEWWITDEKKDTDDNEENTVYQAACGVSMADVENSISMTDINGNKHTLERKAPK